MTLTAPKSQPRILPPEGTHIARLIRVLHIGTVPEEYTGEMKEMNKIDFLFELPEETRVFKEGEGEKPFVISREFTLSMGEKANLRKFIEGILGKSLSQEEAETFDIESLLDKACLISVKYKTSKAGNVRAEVSTASPLMKGQRAPEAINPVKLLTYNNWNEEIFTSLPDFLRAKIESSREYKKMKYPEAEVDISEIPF